MTLVQLVLTLFRNVLSIQEITSTQKASGDTYSFWLTAFWSSCSKILPKAGEVWAIYKNWSPDWAPSRNNRQAEYAIGEIIKCTDASTLFVFLTKVNGHVSVFKPEALKGALEILPQENLRFSHRIPLFLLTDENSGKLRGFYELDPAAVPNILL